MTRGLPQAPVSGIGWKWRGTESRSSSRSVRAPPQTTARQNTAITRLQRVSDLAGHANLLVQLPGWSFGARSQRSGCIAERAAVVSLRDGPAVPAVDAVSMEPLVGELGRAPSLLCPLALVGDAGRKERDVAKLLAVAFRAGEGHRPSIRHLERTAEPTRRMAAGARVGGEHDVVANRATHLVDAIDELFAIVDPLDTPDWLTSHDRQETAAVHAEGALPRAALAASVGDQPFEPGFVE